MYVSILVEKTLNRVASTPNSQIYRLMRFCCGTFAYCCVVLAFKAAFNSRQQLKTIKMKVMTMALVHRDAEL